MSIPPDINERTIGPMIRDAIASDPAFRAEIERQTASYLVKRARHHARTRHWQTIYTSTPFLLTILALCGLLFLVTVLGVALTFGVRP